MEFFIIIETLIIQFNNDTFIIDPHLYYLKGHVIWKNLFPDIYVCIECLRTFLKKSGLLRISNELLI